MRVGDEQVRAGDRRDAVDQVEATRHGQQNSSEYGQAMAAAVPVLPGARAGLVVAAVIFGPYSKSQKPFAGTRLCVHRHAHISPT